MKIIWVAFLAVSSLAWGYEFGKEVPEKVRTQVSTDLQLVETFIGNTKSELHNEIFGNLDGQAYLDWFKKRVTRIGLHTCGGGGASKPVACVIPSLGASKIWLTKYYTEADRPTMSKVSTLFHEARHTEVENGTWSHAQCPTPFKDENGKDYISKLTGAKLEGQFACDTTPYGSYGSALILLKNISKFCTNCTEKVRMDAGIYSDASLDRFIDQDAKKALKDDLYSIDE